MGRVSVSCLRMRLRIRSAERRGLKAEGRDRVHCAGVQDRIPV
jgi:hypothetical protein